MTAPIDNIEDDVYDAVEVHDDGADFDTIRIYTGHPPQDVRRAVKSLIRDENGIKVNGIEDHEKIYTTQ